MRRLTVAMLFATFACNDASGLTLKVFPAGSEQRALVMISDRPCSADASANPDGSDDCVAGVGAPPHGTPRLGGTVRFLTDDPVTDYTDPSQIPADMFLDLAGKSATIRLLPNPNAGDPTNVLVVGLDDTNQPVSFAALDIEKVPAMATYEQVTLAPLNRQGVNAPTITRWTGSSGRYSCVDFATGSAREFFVPTGDPDCDEILLPEECEPYAFDFSGVVGTSPDPHEATCAGSFDAAGSSSLCVLAQNESTCADGVTPVGAVKPACTDTFGSAAPCVPKTMCQPSCDDLGSACFGPSFDTITAGAGGIGHIDCRVAYDLVGAAAPCPGVFSFPSLGSASCTITLETPVSGQIDIDVGTSNGFGSSAKFVDGNFQTNDPPVVVVPGNDPLSACGYDIVPPASASSTLDLGSDTLTLGYARFQGSGAPGLILPIILRYPPVLNQPATCGSNNQTVCVVAGTPEDLSVSVCAGF